jgi:hypothetical protein
MIPTVTYFRDGSGTVIVDAPHTALVTGGTVRSLRRWHLDEADFDLLRAENADVEFRLVEKRPPATSEKPRVHRYVKIPCLTGKHKRSIVTFRYHTVAAMFCIPCERAWTEPTNRPELREIPLDLL